MEIFESREMYLETILKIKKEKGNVRAVDITEELGYAKSSVSVGLKNLREMNYIFVDEKGFICFTKEGEALAIVVEEKHVLLKEFFMSMGVSEKTAERDACKIEHIISDETIEKIRENKSSKSSKNT